MNDLEITLLCAEAMGLGEVAEGAMNQFCLVEHGRRNYDPLHDDAQAMALVKKFGLTIDKIDGQWCADKRDTDFGTELMQDLNRAICECVAKMQRAK